MYALPAALDYAPHDIERFVELSIRRGSPLQSIGKSSEDLRVALGGALLAAAGKTLPRGEALRLLGKFLHGAGSWIAAEPEALLEAAESIGLAAAREDGSIEALVEPRPGVTAERLAAEVEAAEVILSERRARMRMELQTRNRSANSGHPPADPALDRRFMEQALEAAREAAKAGEVPVGAVLVSEDGEALACASNRTLRDGDPTAHAEILALRGGARRMGNHRLTGTTLYVTLEPCPMCAGAIAEARCRRIVYGAADARRGALEGALRLFDLPGVNHRPRIEGGLLEEACRAELIRFFEARRRTGASDEDPHDD